MSRVGGAVLIALGAVLLLAASDTLQLTVEWLAPIACAAIGAVLVASGLGRR